MRKEINQMIKIIVFSTILLFGLLVPFKGVQAKQLPPELVIGDEEGIKIDGDGDYLVNIENVIPGKEWNKKIIIDNQGKDTPFRLAFYVSDNKHEKGRVDFSKAITMTIKYDGKILYKGPLSGNPDDVDPKVPKNELQPKGSIEYPSILKSNTGGENYLDLGLFQQGEKKEMDVHFSMSKYYTNEDYQEENLTTNIWHFYAVQDEKGIPEVPLPSTDKPDKPNRPNIPTVPGTPSRPVKGGYLPRTGEDWRQILLISILGMISIMIVLTYKWRLDKEYPD